MGQRSSKQTKDSSCALINSTSLYNYKNLSHKESTQTRSRNEPVHNKYPLIKYSISFPVNLCESLSKTADNNGNCLRGETQDGNNDNENDNDDYELAEPLAVDQVNQREGLIISNKVAPLINSNVNGNRNNTHNSSIMAKNVFKQKLVQINKRWSYISKFQNNSNYNAMAIQHKQVNNIMFEN